MMHEGEINWYEFAQEIFKIEKIDCKASAITIEQYPTLAKRAKKNTTLSHPK